MSDLAVVLLASAVLNVGLLCGWLGTLAQWRQTLTAWHGHDDARRRQARTHAGEPPP
jgi:hypothetical protein